MDTSVNTRESFIPQEDDLSLRVWLSGIIVYDPPDTPQQHQPFANWTASRYSYDIGIGCARPQNYTGIVRLIGDRVMEEAISYPPADAPQS